jgi:hypothetical protein
VSFIFNKFSTSAEFRYRRICWTTAELSGVISTLVRPRWRTADFIAVPLFIRPLEPDRWIIWTRF